MIYDFFLDGGAPLFGLVPSLSFELQRRQAVKIRSAAAATRTATAMVADGATTIDALANTDRAPNLLIVGEGGNDLRSGKQASAVYNNLAAYCAARQLAGFKVVVLTVLPRGDAGLPANYEAERVVLNQLIRSGYRSFADALVDLAAIAPIGDTYQEGQLAYYEADKITLADRGKVLATKAITAALNALDPDLRYQTEVDSRQYRHISVDAPVCISDKSATLRGLLASNNSTTAAYLCVFDSATIPPVGTKPDLAFPVFDYTEIPASVIGDGLRCYYGLTLALSTRPDAYTVGSISATATAIYTTL